MARSEGVYDNIPCHASLRPLNHGPRFLIVYVSTINPTGFMADGILMRVNGLLIIEFIARYSIWGSGLHFWGKRVHGFQVINSSTTST